MTNSSKPLSDSDQAAFNHILDLFSGEAYYDCLRAACDFLLRAKELQLDGLYQTLATLIQHCAMALAPKADAASLPPACSFCGKSPPAVQLGAGPSVFICNECVATFTGVFATPQSA
jgi:hypothetical protein